MVERILGWKVLDAQFLDEKFTEIEKYGYTADDVLEIVKEMSSDCYDINSFIYATLYLWLQIAKEKLERHFPKYGEEIKEHEVSIYTNFMDSGFDDELSNWSLDQLDEKENAKELLRNWGILKEVA